MRWQDMPLSTHIQDMTYGPQLPVAPWSMGPKQPPFTPLTPLQRLMTPRQPVSPQAQQWLQQNMPANIPLTPIEGSMPSGLMFTRGGQILAQDPNSTRYTNTQPDPAGSHQVPTFIPGPLSNQWNDGYAQNP